MGVECEYPRHIPIPLVIEYSVSRQRFSATLEEAIRCKLTIIAEATAECKMALSPDKMLPYDDHFHPTVSKSAHVGHMTDNRRIGTPFVAVEIKPLKRQVRGFVRSVLID